MRALAAAAAVGLGAALAVAPSAHAASASWAAFPPAWSSLTGRAPVTSAPRMVFAPPRIILVHGYIRSSDERRRTAWAHVVTGSVVRAAANHRATRIGRVRTRTFVGSREVVVVLGNKDGWSRIRYPRLGAQVGWVPSRVLSGRRVQRTRIVVDLKQERLRAYKDGRLKLSVRVAVGAKGSPTPRGTFYLRERVVPAQQGGPYGVLALGLSAFSPYRTDWVGGGQVAIHGTNEPQLIPGHVSNGCIRMHNNDVRALDRIVGVGTPVRVR